MNHYDILGVTRYATQKEIATAFRALAKKYHPDLNKSPDAKERFCQIYEAYSILNDDNKRKLYDSIIFRKAEDIKKETEDTKTYTQWQEAAKKESTYYSEKKYSEFKKKVLDVMKGVAMSLAYIILNLVITTVIRIIIAAALLGVGYLILRMA